MVHYLQYAGWEENRDMRYCTKFKDILASLGHYFYKILKYVKVMQPMCTKKSTLHTLRGLSDVRTSGLMAHIFLHNKSLWFTFVPLGIKKSNLNWRLLKFPCLSDI